MVIYSIEWKPSALHELKRLDRKIVVRVLAVIEGLRNNPFPDGVRKLQGSMSTYRLRVGDYRVIYELLGSQLVIEIVRVRHRKEAYR